MTDRLTAAVNRINSKLPETARQQAISDISRIHSSELLTNNETFHGWLTKGVNVSYHQNNQERGDLVNLLDFENPDNNEFLVVNQFTVIENHSQKRPDIVLFINGLPLVVIELKNPADENATVKAAYQQIDTYKATIPSLFTYNALVVISDGLEARAGSLSADFSRFMTWKTSDGKAEAPSTYPQLEVLINGMLNKTTLLDLIRHFIVFEKSKAEDEQGIISIHTVKKVAAYHQYYAVNKAVDSTLKATSAQGNKKAGVV